MLQFLLPFVLLLFITTSTGTSLAQHTDCNSELQRICSKEENRNASLKEAAAATKRLNAAIQELFQDKKDEAALEPFQGSINHVDALIRNVEMHACDPLVTVRFGNELASRHRLAEALHVYSRLKNVEQDKLKHCNDLTGSIETAKEQARTLDKIVPRLTFDVSGPDAARAVVILDRKQIKSSELREQLRIDPGEHTYSFEITRPSATDSAKDTCSVPSPDQYLSLHEKIKFILAERQTISIPLRTVDIVLAATPTNYKGLALDEFNKGREAATREDWAGASLAFASAGRLSPSPAASFNWALAELRQDHRYSAFELLSRTPETNVEGPLRGRIRECREAIRKELSDVSVRILQDDVRLIAKRGDSVTHLEDAHLEELRISADPPEYIVASGADTSPARSWEKGKNFKIVFDPAKSYRITAQSIGFQKISWEYSLSNKPWDPEFVIDLEAVPSPPPQKNPLRLPLMLTSVVGGAAAVAGGTIVFNSSREIDSIRDDPSKCPSESKCHDEHQRRINDHLIPQNRWGWGVAIAGGALTVGSVVLLVITSPKAKSRVPTSNSWSPRMIHPVVQADFRGILVEGSLF